MYRQWAALKLNVSIYRYHIGAGAVTYWVAPQVLRFFESKRVYEAIANERKEMKKVGLFNPGKY